MFLKIFLNRMSEKYINENNVKNQLMEIVRVRVYAVKARLTFI